MEVIRECRAVAFGGVAGGIFIVVAVEPEVRRLGGSQSLEGFEGEVVRKQLFVWVRQLFLDRSGQRLVCRYFRYQGEEGRW